MAPKSEKQGVETDGWTEEVKSHTSMRSCLMMTHKRKTPILRSLDVLHSLSGFIATFLLLLNCHLKPSSVELSIYINLVKKNICLPIHYH